MAKEALKSEVGEGLLGTRPDAAVVGEILLALEAGNPTRSPATSPLLNGKWKVLYASGVSPGLKALQLLLKGAPSAPTCRTRTSRSKPSSRAPSPRSARGSSPSR